MLNHEMIPVSEHHGLCRDARSNSIINIDTDAYHKAMLRKSAARAQKEDIELLKRQVVFLIEKCDALEKEVSTLRGINS